ncbi:MAG: CHAT domain-containing tetratricopeptide repeat protein, partial [Gemmatimonadales bacterium]
ADEILNQAGQIAAKHEAHGYQAQLLTQQALIAHHRKQPERALTLLAQAMDLARAAGGNRIVAEIALDAAKIQREQNQLPAAEQTLRDGIQIARSMEERFLLPRLLAELADLHSTQRRYTEAARLLEEATDLMEGFFTTSSSPWVQSRLVSGMDEVFIARIRLEGMRDQDLPRMFSVIEQARGRSLLQLLVNRPLSAQQQPQELRDGERQISTLQRRLLRTTDKNARQRLLDQIFTAEERLAPISTTLFDRTRRAGPRTAATLRDLQRALGPDEIFIEFALANPDSYAIIATRTSTRLQRLPGRDAIRSQVELLLKKVRADEEVTSEARRLSDLLVGSVSELKTRRRLIVSPDGELHQLPFELLTVKDGQRLLDSHVVSYVPSGSVLVVIRTGTRPVTPRRVLAVSASPASNTGPIPSAKAVTRSVYDLDAAQLRPLPSADDEARSVGSILGPEGTTVLLGEAATEAELKRQPLHEFQVLHFAVHGIPSTKFPARAALLMHPGGSDDGVLQAREILMFRLGADLVTLSACDTGSGSVHGQDGPASLVRPFIAAGARAVVANLWAADDTFSLALMREFYRRLAAGADIAEAMRDAKLHMLKSFGSEAVPRLWSGVLVYGDGTGKVSRSDAAASRKD